MKNYFISSVGVLSLLLASQVGQAQTAFHKYSLSVSLTGGATRAIYSTRDITDAGPSKINHREYMKGEVDPLIVEFGICDKFGIGFTAGGDRFQVDPAKYYNYTPLDPSTKIPSYTNYFTFDANYHPYVTKKVDLSVFAGIGTLKVYIADYPDHKATEMDAQTPAAPDGPQQNSAQTPQQPVSDYTNYYHAKGAMFRGGVKMRYYFWGRLGVMTMITAFAGNARPTHGVGAFGMDYSTSISGVASEFGLCFRFF